MERRISIAMIAGIVFTLSGCYTRRHYKPTVMPAGVSKLTRKQIKIDRTN